MKRPPPRHVRLLSAHQLASVTGGGTPLPAFRPGEPPSGTPLPAAPGI